MGREALCLVAIVLLAFSVGSACTLAQGVSYVELWRKYISGWISTVSWSPSGDKLLALTGMKAVVLSSSGDVLWSVDKVKAASWSPDGSAVAMAIGSKLVVYSPSGEKLWEVDANDIYTFAGNIAGLAWSPSGDKLAIATHVPIVLSREGKVLWVGDEVLASSVDWSPDGEMLAVGGYRRVYAYSSEGKELWRYEASESKQVNKVFWSPDGSKIAAVVGVVELHVLTREGRKLWSKDMGPKSDILSVDWHPDGSKLAIGIMKGYRVYVFSASGETLWHRRPGTAVFSVAWSPDGSKIAVTSFNVSVYSEVGDLLWIKYLGRLVLSLDWSPDGKMLAAGDAAGKVYVFGEAVGKPPKARLSVKSEEGFVVGAEIVFDASESVDPDGTIVKYVWDFGDGRKLETDSPVVTHTYSAPGTYTVVLTVVDDDGLRSTASTEVTVEPAEEAFEFRLVVEPSRVEMKQGETRTVTVRVELVRGKARQVELSVVGLPSEVKYSLEPSTVTPPGESRLVIEAGAAKGEFRAVVRGVSDGAVKTAELSLVVEEKRCVIATVTYGSEVEGVVDFLREFRDSVVLSTYAGRRFYVAFDAFYYSWSPGVAQQIRRNPWLKPFARAALYPLILSLEASALAAQPLAELSPELAVFAAGAVASALIGLVYFSPLVYVACRKAGAGSRTLKALGLVLAASLLASLVGELLRIDAALTLATSAYVVSMVCLASLAPAVLIGRAEARLREGSPG